MHRIEAYIRLALIFIAIISILYLPILIKLKNKGISPIRQISYIGLFCSIFLIIFATILFTPITFEPENHFLNLVPFNWIIENDFEQFIVEKLPNILLFISLGLFIPVVFKSKRRFLKTLLITFIITFEIEFFQYFIGRLSDIDDIIMNLTGGAIGYLIFTIMNKIFKNTKFWNKCIAEPAE